MKSIFILTYGWRDMVGPELTETHPSIDSAQKSGDAFIASEHRFKDLNVSAPNPAFYQIDRYNFDTMILRYDMDMEG